METGRLYPVGSNTTSAVIRLAALQVARDYNGIPSIFEMSEWQIKFLYDGLRPEIRKYLKESEKNGN